MRYWVLLVVWVLGWCCIPQLLLLNKRPTATLAWLWALILFPVVGPILYLMIGSESVKRRRIERRQGFRQRERWASARSNATKNWELLTTNKAMPSAARSLLQTLSVITNLPVATASKLDVLYKGAAFYEFLEKDIRSARDEILIETYIWRNDETGRKFLDLLGEAAGRGVKVRVLVDELGSLTLKESYFHPLVAAGGTFSWCHTLSPLRNRYSFNLRNHRKLQIIDGTVAYVGGMNIGNEYLGLKPECGDWADVQIRIEGSVVGVFQEIFAEDWFFATGKEDKIEIPPPQLPSAESTFVQVLRGGPDEEDQPMLRVNIAMVQTAQKRLWISTGYFVPGETMQSSLQVAAARGVDVRLLISKKNEHPFLVKAGRSYYNALLRQGIRIFEYNKGIEHSKYILVDDDWASIGSSNLDERSMRLNFELSLLTYSTETNRTLSDIFEETISKSVEIDRKTFAQRPFSEKLIESALRPLSPVL